MSDTLPSLNALRAFDAVARELSVTKAAESLHVTHGAVSRQIRLLEQQLGVRLFRKVGRGIALTAEGERLRATTSDAFEQLTLVCGQLQRKAVDAPFVLACPGSFLARWFIPRLDRLHHQCPGLDLHLTASEGAHWPLRSGVDAALCFDTPPWPASAQVIELAPEWLGPVMRPDLAKLGVNPDHEALLDLPLLHTASREQAWPIWFAAKGLDSERMRRDQVFEHLNYLLEAALVGLGVAIAPAYLVEEDLRAGRLVAPWGFIETPARLGLWLPQGAEDQRSHALVRWLEGELDKLSP